MKEEIQHDIQSNRRRYGKKKRFCHRPNPQKILVFRSVEHCSNWDCHSKYKQRRKFHRRKPHQTVPLSFCPNNHILVHHIVLRKQIRRIKDLLFFLQTQSCGIRCIHTPRRPFLCDARRTHICSRSEASLHNRFVASPFSRHTKSK